jgi:DNA repair exonuclease SbcCD ATPase subunit
MAFLGLLKKEEPTAAELKQAIADISVPDLEAKVNTLEARRRALLLDGSDAEVAEIEAEIEIANRNVERACAAIDELKRKLPAAEERELLGEVARRGAESRKAWERFRQIMLETDRHAAALADLLTERRTLQEQIAQNNLFVEQNGRPDLSIRTPSQMLAEETGVSEAEQHMAFRLPGYWGRFCDKPGEKLNALKALTLP